MDAPPATPKELIEAAKRALRKKLKALRKAHPEPARAARSAAIVQALKSHSLWQQAKGVGLFAPLMERGEVDLRPLLQLALAETKSVYFPFMDPSDEGFSTGFRRVQGASDLEAGPHSFLAPPTHLPSAQRGDVDLVIVPALGVAASGHRLGYGSGFYDATLPDLVPPAKSMVVAFDFQLLA